MQNTFSVNSTAKDEIRKLREEISVLSQNVTDMKIRNHSPEIVRMPKRTKKSKKGL